MALSVPLQRFQSVLSHISDRPENDTIEFIQRLERNLQKIFGNNKNLNLLLNPTPTAGEDEDPGEPSNQFVKLSRSLQSDKSGIGYNNFKQASRSRTSSHTHGPRGEAQAIDTLFDPRVLLGAAAVGLALSFLPSSSPVPQSIFSRAWPHLLQLAIAYFIHIRKKQDVKDNLERSHVLLYITSALIQVFSALKDFQGHTVASFARRALLGPIDPLMGYMKNILLALPSFLWKTVFLSGISILGKITVISTIAVSVVVALGLLIVVAAEKL